MATVDEVLSAARSQLGKPYVLGGPGGRRAGDTSSFDCSGFVAWAFAQAGLGGLTPFTDALPAQAALVSDPQAGDLVLYGPANDPAQPGVRYPHVGIYLGSGQTIDASWGAGVTVHGVYTHLPVEYRRVPGLSSPSPAPSSPAPPAPGSALPINGKLAGVLIGVAALAWWWFDE